MRAFLWLVTVCYQQLLMNGQLEFTTPDQVKSTDSEITLGLTLLSIKRDKSIAELFQVHKKEFI